MTTNENSLREETKLEAILDVMLMCFVRDTVTKGKDQPRLRRAIREKVTQDILSLLSQANKEAVEGERERIEKVFNELVNTWKDPDFEFERYDTLVAWTKNVFTELKKALHPHSKDEKCCEKCEKENVTMNPKDNPAEQPYIKLRKELSCSNPLCACHSKDESNHKEK